MEQPFLRFLDHTQRRSTVSRTPLDEWSARRRDLYLTTHDTHNRQISMPPVGFETKTSAGERPAATRLLTSWFWIKDALQGLNLIFCFISELETEMPVTICAIRNNCMKAPCLCYFCLPPQPPEYRNIRMTAKPQKKEEPCLLPILNKCVNMWTVMLVMIKVGSSQWRILLII